MTPDKLLEIIILAFSSGIFLFILFRIVGAIAGTASIFIALLSIEGLVLFFYLHPAIAPQFILNIIKSTRATHQTNLIQFNEGCARYDKQLFYTLKPGSCTYDDTEFKTTINVNSVGLRAPEESLNKPEIIFLGDSYTMGWGVEGEDSFPEIVGRELHVKILNAGISSYGTAREILLLERLDTSNTKAIVIQYCKNDLNENIHFIKNNFSLPVGDEKYYNELVELTRNTKNYLPFIFSRTFLLSIIKTTTKEKNKADNSNDAAKIFLEILQNSNKIKNYRYKIYILDTCQSDTFMEDLEANINKLEHKEKFVVLKEINIPINSRIYRFAYDEHLNKDGHQYIGREISKLLQYKIIAHN